MEVFGLKKILVLLEEYGFGLVFCFVLSRSFKGDFKFLENGVFV